MDSPYKRELEVAIRVVEQAARLSLAVLPNQDKGAIEKVDASSEHESNLGPVTIGDFAIQALLTSSLHAAFPTDSFVGEEDASALRDNAVLRQRVWETLQQTVVPDPEKDTEKDIVLPASADDMCDMIDRCQNAPGAGRVWVFDPIDGTKTFLRREMFAINVALVVDGQQTVAVVACPLLSPEPPTESLSQVTIQNDSIDPSGRGSLLYAVRGHGAYVRPLSDAAGPGVARRLQDCGTTRLLRPVTCDFMQDSALDGVHRAVAARLGVAYPGSDLLGWVPRWAALATGWANTTVWVYKRRDRHAKVWDHAGAMLLFEEVGGRITDVDGKPIDLLAGRKLKGNFGFVAAPADVHGIVLAAVRDVLQEQGRGDLLGEPKEQ
ncbi:inositol monophosphatase family protein [Ophiostoma piceae UAMH 11346]|uniref:Inositol monophosphatase family protein n=1 Tax=Ophiostoma piceae (strain UAMH 11346) TaxID=1262450 RepID=S3CDC3_OPHP1|nr:inositol monophosphatase family protein [Ophiostoma piceae UAMH 11346]